MGQAAKVILSAVPRLWAALRRTAPSESLTLETEAAIEGLTDGARIVLWHLKDRGLRPDTLRDKLLEARSKSNVDQAINELSRAGLIDHDFSGTRFVRPEILPIVRRVLK